MLGWDSNLIALLTVLGNDEVEEDVLENGQEVKKTKQIP